MYGCAELRNQFNAGRYSIGESFKGTKLMNRDVHESRLMGVVVLADGNNEYKLEVQTNHHHVYYEKMFEAMRVSAQKNHDYAGGLQNHPLGNFLRTKDSGIDPKVGMWVRMCDKVGRIETFFKEGKLMVENEGIEDAFMDLGNYCFLMLALLSEDEDTRKPMPRMEDLRRNAEYYEDLEKYSG